jgi:hypothetical protein
MAAVHLCQMVGALFGHNIGALVQTILVSLVAVTGEWHMVHT